MIVFSISLQFLRNQNHIFDIRYSVTESCVTMGHGGSSPEFMLILGRVGLGHFSCGSSQENWTQFARSDRTSVRSGWV